MKLKGYSAEEAARLPTKAYFAAVDEEAKRRDAETKASDLPAEQRRWKYTRTMISAALAKERHLIFVAIAEDLVKPVGRRLAALEQQNRDRSASADRDNGQRRALGAAAALSEGPHPTCRDAGGGMRPARTRLRLKEWKHPA